MRTSTERAAFFLPGATRCMPVLFDMARTEIAIARPQAARARVEHLGARSRRGPNTFCRSSDLVDGPPMLPVCSVRPPKEQTNRGRAGLALFT